ERTAPAAGVRDARHFGADDGALTRDRREERRELVPARLARLDRLAARVQAHDARAPLEGAEHEADAAVLAQVRERLDAAAGEVGVGDLARTEHAEGVQALRRAVDQAVVGSRRGRDEEQVLRLDEVPQRAVDRLEDLSHANPPEREAAI